MSSNLTSVTGSDDGLHADNRRGLKVRPMVTPQEIRDVYITGLNITDPSTGEPLPDSTYQTYIDNAVAMLETYLDISIVEVRNHTENKDYRVNDYAEWGYFMLNNFPVIQVNSMNLTFFRDEQGQPEVTQEIPNNWIRLQEHDGMVRLVPNARFPGSLQLGQSGNYFPEILRAQFVPHLWDVNYDFGFKDGCIPTMIVSVVAKFAAMQSMIVGGNLVLGAGIAASSISVDGMSQMIQTTQSAENSAFSATIKEYSSQVFGRSKGDPFAELRILLNYYKGASMNII